MVFFYPKTYKFSQICEAFKQKYKGLQNIDAQWESKINRPAWLVGHMLSSSSVFCWQVPRTGPAPTRTDVAPLIGDASQGGRRQQAYKTEIIGGVVVHTPIQVIRGSCGYHGDEKSEWGLCE